MSVADSFLGSASRLVSETTPQHRMQVSQVATSTGHPHSSAALGRVAIIGGGPGGLMTAYFLQRHATTPFRATIFEASQRLGGKILTDRFSVAPVSYEAGAAELYDYSWVGPDPLRELVAELGLPTTLMEGNKVLTRAMSGEGWEAAERALEEFDRRARACMSPKDFYNSDWKENEGDPLSRQTFQSILDEIPVPSVRHYIHTLIHSDLATEPARTNAVYGMQNYLMNDPAYMRLYTIDGGIERLPQELARRIEAEVLLEHRVLRVEKTDHDTYRVNFQQGSEITGREFDQVVVALPNHLLPTIEWGGATLAEAMARHHAHYDYPAHYLRITILFREKFWRQHLNESFFMLDAFGGCCVYDESSRNDSDTLGVLGWLLGGEAAEQMSSLSDSELIARVLDSLPGELHPGREQFLEGRVHRWVKAVNGLPAGYPSRPMEVRHVPEPRQHPNLLVVGDYLFDSTLNGVLDSADFVAEWLAGELAQPTRR